MISEILRIQNKFYCKLTPQVCETSEDYQKFSVFPSFLSKIWLKDEKQRHVANELVLLFLL